MAFLTIGTNAQNRGRISGTVVDKFTQKPIFNVNVILDGSTTGTVSDSNGVFRITGIETRSYNIVFSIIGYKKQTLFNIIVNAGNENNFNVELEPEENTLAEVVVKANKKQ